MKTSLVLWKLEIWYISKYTPMILFSNSIFFYPILRNTEEQIEHWQTVLEFNMEFMFFQFFNFDKIFLYKKIFTAKYNLMLKWSIYSCSMCIHSTMLDRYPYQYKNSISKSMYNICIIDNYFYVRKFCADIFPFKVDSNILMLF